MSIYGNEFGCLLDYGAKEIDVYFLGNTVLFFLDSCKGERSLTVGIRI